MRLARIATALVAGLAGAGSAQAARYYEFQVTGTALRPGVYSVLSSYPQPQIAGVYTLRYTSTDTFAFDIGLFPAVPDTTRPGWNGYPYPQIASSGGTTSSQTYALSSNYFFVLDTASLSSPGSIGSLDQPGGPNIGFTFSFSDVAAGDVLRPLNVAGGSFSYNAVVDPRGPTAYSTDPGQIISVLARTTDIAPASLRATEQLVVSVLPEPATWATMILGFGLVGAALRRGRPRATGAAFA